MADRADERLKALKASMKEALGKLTGSDELEAEGARERLGEPVVAQKATARSGPTAKKVAKARASRARTP